LFGYYWRVGDDKKNTLNCHKAIEDQEGQDSAAHELCDGRRDCDGSRETGAGTGRAGEPSGEPQSLPAACWQVWQREAEDIPGFCMLRAGPLKYICTQVKWRTAMQSLLSYKNPEIGTKTNYSINYASRKVVLLASSASWLAAVLT